MTVLELKKHLTENSPFKIKGSEDIYSFTDSTFKINDGKTINYTLDTNEGHFKIAEVDGVIPFFINTKLLISNDEEVVLNYDEQLLRNDPYRHPEAVNGYFVLLSDKKK